MKQITGFYNRRELKERGWTLPLVFKFLGEHDKEWGGGMWNSRLGRTAGVLLYAIHRVEAAETTPEFIEAKQKIEARKKRGRRTGSAEADSHQIERGS